MQGAVDDADGVAMAAQVHETQVPWKGSRAAHTCEAMEPSFCAGFVKLNQEPLDLLLGFIRIY